MNQHITQEQVKFLVDKFALPVGLGKPYWYAIFNDAIQHYIDNCTDDSLHELLRLGVAENKALQDKIANLEHSVRFAAALAQPASVDSIDTSMERVEKDAGNGWMPIESAPKDGMEILLGHPDGSLAVAYWNGTCFIEGDFKCDWATHWKPKPPAPTGEPG